MDHSADSTIFDAIERECTHKSVCRMIALILLPQIAPCLGHIRFRKVDLAIFVRQCIWLIEAHDQMTLNFVSANNFLNHATPFDTPDTSCIFCNSYNINIA